MVVLGASVLGVLQASDDDSALADLDSAPTTRASTTTRAPTTTSSTSTTTTTTLPPQPEPIALPPIPSGGLGRGASGDVVAAYQLRLIQLHFDPGPPDGSFGESMAQSVVAVQKLFGMPRTGVINEPTRFAISTFQWPAPMTPDAEPSRVEVDLDRQVMIVWRDRQVALITTVSTGSGKVFCGGHDGCQYATTPAGRFELGRFVNGWRDGDLGRMYKPFYFNGGLAVHGYQSVPTEPASHGCVRIPMEISEYWHSLVAIGEPIYIVGTAAAPYGRAPAPPRRYAAPTTAPPTTALPTPTTTAATAPPTTKPPSPTTTKAPPTTKPPAPTTTAPPPTT